MFRVGLRLQVLIANPPIPLLPYFYSIFMRNASLAMPQDNQTTLAKRCLLEPRTPDLFPLGLCHNHDDEAKYGPLMSLSGVRCFGKYIGNYGECVRM
jgi:hypothetical protein